MNLFLDLQNGISGDMAVAALLSLEGDPDLPGLIDKKIRGMGLSGFSIEAGEEKRNGLMGMNFVVTVDTGAQKHRSFRDIEKLLSGKALSADERELAVSIFTGLARAESYVHGVDPEEVHFHEVGAVDSIVDIVGFAVLFLRTDCTRVFASPVALGSGRTDSAHGSIPLPSPAALRLLDGVPVQGSGLPFEMTTPTGAAIVKTVVDEFGPFPPGRLGRSGMGFGSRRTGRPNVLRVIEIDTRNPARDARDARDASGGGDAVAVINATIDDSTPEEMAYLHEMLLRGGALDAFITPVTMKKNRPGFNLTVICSPETLDGTAEAILRNSSTFGVRFHYCSRKKLERSFSEVLTEFGRIKLKIGTLNGEVVRIAPEYEDCRTAAEGAKTDLRTVYELAIRIWQRENRKEPHGGG